MNISKKVFSAILIITALVFMVGGYQLQTLNLSHQDPTASVNVFVLTETTQGSHSYQGGNLITDLGENYVRNILGFNNETNNNETKWISLSNAGTPLVTWTELATEVDANGFSRALGTVVAWNNGTDYAYNVTKKFTATGTQQLQTAGLQWNDTPVSDNNLFSASDFTQTTFNANDNCTITWVITFDAN